MHYGTCRIQVFGAWLMLGIKAILYFLHFFLHFYIFLIINCFEIFQHTITWSHTIAAVHSQIRISINPPLSSPPSGWGDHQDHEGLHQHDGEETLQHHVSDQRRQFLGQVIATNQPEPSVHPVVTDASALLHRSVGFEGGSRTKSSRLNQKGGGGGWAPMIERRKR